MQKTLALRHLPPAAQIATGPASHATARLLGVSIRGFSPPARPHASADRVGSSPPSLQGQAKPRARGRWDLSSQPSEWRWDGRPGQARMKHDTAVARQEANALLGENVRQALHAAGTEAGLQPADLKGWERLVLALRREHGGDGVWAAFGSIQEKGLLDLLVQPDAHVLRDQVLAAALDNDSRLAALVAVAQQLCTESRFQWPGLYVKILHFYLGRARHMEAVRWHMRLAPTLSPGTEVFGALISRFVVDPTPQMQSSLTALYVCSTERGLYDCIIPVLFASGQSKLARTWRKRLVLFKDVPTTTKSRPFLRFLAGYYPSITLTGEELSAAGLGGESPRCGDDGGPPKPSATVPDGSTSQYSDSLVAKWFASSWVSVEFAMNLVHGLGLRIIGPRSLQSLALREPDTKGVTSRIAQLERLGISVAPQTYCKVLVFFAKHGEDGLLTDLLNSDIHPDEFDNVQTRKRLMAASLRDGDWTRERLLKGIERATESATSSGQLDSLLRGELPRRTMGQTSQALDRMEALGLSMAQNSAAHLLELAFRDLGEHPPYRARRERHTTYRPLSRAINITRRIAGHDVAIPVRNWRLLLYNLGRLGRFDELEQLSMEIVRLYVPPCRGLVPVHQEDLPLSTAATRGTGPMLAGMQTRKGKGDAGPAWGVGETASCHKSDGDESLEELFFRRIARLRKMDEGGSTGAAYTMSTDGSPGAGSERDPQGSQEGALQGPSNQADAPAHIPADLPFTHREHPVQKIFDAHLQRSIVRWGFDRTLETRPTAAALMEVDTLGIGTFDVACGVRLLALLRDRGVLIDTQIVRTAILSRIILGQVPGRRRHRSRDSNEMSAESLKKLVDRAWGSEVLPDLPEMLGELERQKPRLWRRYPKLFGKAFDPWHEAKDWSP